MSKKPNTINFVHFGNQCAPGIIINEILGNKQKNLFQLGIYEFDNIYKYLVDESYESIYDNKYLVICKDNGEEISPTICPSQTVGFQHEKKVTHTKYGFVFNHDYNYNSNYELTNYNFIVDIFNQKISNFKEILYSQNNFVYFIVFTFQHIMIDRMIEYLLTKRKHFKLIIFTSQHNIANDLISNNKYIEYYTVIKLDRQLTRWYKLEGTNKNDLYAEIYNKFLLVDDLISYLPKFEDTVYGKNI